MKSKYDHITKLENIMVRQEKTITKLESLLKELDAQQKDYETLYGYYYSPQRDQDLEDEEDNLIPQDLSRGVLSEDKIYDLVMNSHDVAIHMIETALRILKTNA